ncbi:hypothetical protein E2C01_084246 [Portunus trituberculatus]|uniref:Uncharacterized protein n=1 Tax=Portunus trituberculatus TaxID=210409 RepID=A0A5B7J5T3_PORTR|nr:hypothetical protein [Portunus trituberculatus]
MTQQQMANEKAASVSDTEMWSLEQTSHHRVECSLVAIREKLMMRWKVTHWGKGWPREQPCYIALLMVLEDAAYYLTPIKPLLMLLHVATERVENF